MRIIISVTIAAGVVLSACAEHKGPMERTGERIDEIGDNIADGEPPLKKKGALEKAGESIDDTLNGK